MSDLLSKLRSASSAQYHPLVVMFVAVSAGIVCDRVWPRPLALWWSLAGVACLAWFACRWQRSSRLAACALLLAAAATGAAWHHFRWFTIEGDNLVECVGDDAQPIAVRVVTLEEPRHLPAAQYHPLRARPSEDRSRVQVEVAAVRDGQEWRSASGTTTLTVQGRLNDVFPGDTLQVFGTARRLRSPENPGQTDFAAHRRADRVLMQLRADEGGVTVVEHGSHWSVAALLEATRRHGEAMLHRYVRSERSGFAAALLLNERHQLDMERTEAFLQTNMIHYLAISGMHVAILAGTLFIALRWGLLPRRWALVAVALLTTAYVVLTGAPPSAVRSLVLVLMVCLAAWVGRPTTAFNCLGAAGLVVLAINPADLFRVGAQLSFLAVGAMAWLGPYWLSEQDRDPLDRLVAATRPWPVRMARWLVRWVWRPTVVTLFVWTLTLPLIMSQFHLVSPVAILLSPLLWLPIGAAMMSGFAVMLLGWLVPPLGWICGRVCDISLGVIDRLVFVGNDLPMSHYWVPGPSDWWLAGLYVGIVLWAGFPRWTGRRRWGVAFLVTWVTVGAANAMANAHRGDHVECSFISVGHGCSVLVELPNGRNVLYDAGQLGSPTFAARTIAGYLWWRGITRLDAVVISHADTDHYNALPSLVEQITVNRVIVSPLMFRDDREGSDKPAVDFLRKALDRARVPIEVVQAGDVLPGSESYALRVLHPPREGVPARGKRDDRDNPNSIVLAVEYAGRSLVLPGDLEKAGIAWLLQQSPYDCDVLLAPHHGSAQSNPSGFADWSRPEWVVISGDHDTSPAVFAAYEQRGARVLHTARNGAIRVRLSRSGVEAAHWNGDRFDRLAP